MDPTAKVAYDLAISRIETMHREAERDRLIAALERDRPGPFDRLCITAGDRIVSLGERLRQHGAPQWRSEENPASGI